VVSIRPRARIWFQVVLLVMALGAVAAVMGVNGSRLWGVVAASLEALACLLSLVACYFHRHDPPQQVSERVEVPDFPATWVDPSLPSPITSLERTRDR
jgi:hypothetical protein